MPIADLAGYNVYRGTASGGPYTKINGSLLATSQFTDPGPLVDGTTYYYVVTAVDALGSESGYSSELVLTADILAPPAPKSFFIREGNTHAKFDWARLQNFDEVVKQFPTLISYWKLGETSGTTAVDETGFSNGTHVNAVLNEPSLIVGDANPSARYTGTNSYTNFGNPVAFQRTSGSLHCRVKTSTTNVGLYETIFVKTNAFGLFVYDGKLAIYDYGGAARRDTGILINDGLPHTVGISFQSGVTNGTKVYLDGKLVLTTTMTVAGQASALCVGGQTNFQLLAATIDEPAIFGGLLTPEEFNTLHLMAIDNLDLAGYNVYRGTSFGGPFTKLNSNPIPDSDWNRYKDTGLTNGTTYYYFIRAVDTHGNESANSEQKNATPFASPVLVDDFNDNSIDTTKWPNNYGVIIEEVEGKAKLTGDNSEYSSYMSGRIYDLTGNAMVVKLSDSSSNGNDETYLWFSDVLGNWVAWDVWGGLSINAGVNVDGVSPTFTQMPYDPVNHKYLRIRESSGTLYWDTSPDGKTWTTFRSISTPWEIGSEWGAEIGTGPQTDTAYFDNFRFSPDITAPPQLSGLAASPGDAEALLQWPDSAASDFLRYRVYRRNNNGTWPDDPTAETTDSEFTDTGLVNNQLYAYRVAVIDTSLNESGFVGDETTPSNLSDAYQPDPPLITRVSVRPILGWQYILADSDTMENIARLSHARNKQLNLILNRPGSATFNVRLDEEESFFIERWRTCVKAMRDDQVRWSGPVTKTIQKTADMKMDVTAEGWFEEVNGRIVRQGQNSTHNNVGADVVTWALLDKANKQRTGLAVQNPDGTNGTLAQAIRPTHVTQGGVFLATGHTMPIRSKTFEKDQVIGQEIQQLSDIENGFDMMVDHETRELNLYYPRYGQDRPNVLFAHRVGPVSNVISVEESVDATQMTNRFTAIGKYGGGMAEDTDSMDYYGVMREGVGTLSDVAQQNILLAYAGVEVAIRRGGLIVYTLVPAAYNRRGNVPKLFDDYDLGDTVRLTVKNAGRFELNRQAVRVFGLTLDIDDNGTEKITALNTSPTG
jgi:fibronectin type 3 domain-containing protein